MAAESFFWNGARVEINKISNLRCSSSALAEIRFCFLKPGEPTFVERMRLSKGRSDRSVHCVFSKSSAVGCVNIQHHIHIENNLHRRCFSANARQRGSSLCFSIGNADPNAAAVAKSIAASRSSAISSASRASCQRPSMHRGFQNELLCHLRRNPL